MEFDPNQLRDAFLEQGAVFLDLVQSAGDLGVPTALDGWDCAVLVGHVSTAIEGLWRWQGDRSSSAVGLDAISWWDAVDPSVNAEFAQKYAQKRSHQDMRDKIAETVAHARQVVTDAPPDLSMSIAGGAGWATFDQVLATRTFELTVHGLDLAAAIASKASMAPSALVITGGILDSRLNGERPGDIVGNTDWVLAATGRIAHTDPRLPTVS